MNTLQNRFNNLFDDSFFRPGRSDDDLSLGTWHPVVDMYDEDDRVVIKAELPGVDKKDIAVDVKDRQRAFSLPADVDSDKIEADFKDGLLKIEVPKPEKQKPQKITIH
jgi:HSP20 family protein